MLEELQRLQVHIGVLKTRLAQLESENTSLREKQEASSVQHETQIEQKNSFIAQKQQEIQNLNQQLTESRNQFKEPFSGNSG